MKTKLKVMAIDKCKKMVLLLVFVGVLFGIAKTFWGNWDEVYSGRLIDQNVPFEHTGVIITRTDPTILKPFDFCSKGKKVAYVFETTHVWIYSGVSQYMKIYECR